MQIISNFLYLLKKKIIGKRKSKGLENILESITKKKKINTLIKSKLDWEKFKKEEGLEEELKEKTKDG